MFAQTKNLITNLEDIVTPFDPNRFEISRKPIFVTNFYGKVDSTAILQTKSCLDLLIMYPGNIGFFNPYRTIWGYLEEESSKASIIIGKFIENCCKFESIFNPDWEKDYYIYLTVDARVVKQGKTHRNGGWHFDGMQGRRYKTKLPVCHQYIMSTALPTEFNTGPVSAFGLDENKHNWFTETGKQVKKENIFVADPYKIYFMTAYQIHRCAIALKNTPRLFLRLDFSLKKQDRLGNTKNPLIKNYPFRFYKRDMPKYLKYKINDTGWSKQ